MMQRNDKGYPPRRRQRRGPPLNLGYESGDDAEPIAPSTRKRNETEQCQDAALQQDQDGFGAGRLQGATTIRENGLRPVQTANDGTGLFVTPEPDALYRRPPQQDRASGGHPIRKYWLYGNPVGEEKSKFDTESPGARAGPHTRRNIRQFDPWPVYDPVLVVEGDRLPPARVILSDCIAFQLFRHAQRKNFSHGRLAELWPANFTTDGYPHQDLEPVGRPAIQECMGLDGPTRGYATVAGRIYCGTQGFNRMLAKDPRAFEDKHWMVGSKPKAVKGKKVTKDDWIATCWHPCRKPGGAECFRDVDTNVDFDRLTDAQIKAASKNIEHLAEQLATPAPTRLSQDPALLKGLRSLNCRKPDNPNFKEPSLILCTRGAPGLASGPGVEGGRDTGGLEETPGAEMECTPATETPSIPQLYRDTGSEEDFPAEELLGDQQQDLYGGEPRSPDSPFGAGNGQESNVQTKSGIMQAQRGSGHHPQVEMPASKFKSQWHRTLRFEADIEANSRMKDWSEDWPELQSVPKPTFWESPNPENAEAALKKSEGGTSFGRNRESCLAAQMIFQNHLQSHQSERTLDLTLENLAYDWKEALADRQRLHDRMQTIYESIGQVSRSRALLQRARGSLAANAVQALREHLTDEEKETTSGFNVEEIEHRAKTFKAYRPGLVDEPMAWFAERPRRMNAVQDFEAGRSLDMLSLAADTVTQPNRSVENQQRRGRAGHTEGLETQTDRLTFQGLRQGDPLPGPSGGKQRREVSASATLKEIALQTRTNLPKSRTAQQFQEVRQHPGEIARSQYAPMTHVQTIPAAYARDKRRGAPITIEEDDKSQADDGSTDEEVVQPPRKRARADGPAQAQADVYKQTQMREYLSPLYPEKVRKARQRQSNVAPQPADHSRNTREELAAVETWSETNFEDMLRARQRGAF